MRCWRRSIGHTHLHHYQIITVITTTNATTTTTNTAPSPTSAAVDDSWGSVKQDVREDVTGEIDALVTGTASYNARD